MPAGFCSTPTTEGEAMDGHESLHDRDKRLRKERQEQSDRDELERNAELASKRARDAERDKERLRNEARRERDEHAELVEGYREHISDQQDELNRIRREKEVVVDALRALVAALPDNTDALLKYFAGEPLVKAHREAKELLAIIDAQQKPPTTTTDEG